MPTSSAKGQLSALVESASTTSEEIAITVNGTPAATLVSVDEWES
ncbi:MAG: type II toxin-antitoxin system Phd/YefM family antitoxin [Propionibacteriaceae bacterium]|nr:type II toxin-antitoxin system Phd/YefM family antitoxin [Propionibacteriaceae bacterium]